MRGTSGGLEIWGSFLRIAHAWSREDIYRGVHMYMVCLVAIMGGILAVGSRMRGLALTGLLCVLPGSIMMHWVMFPTPDLPGVMYGPLQVVIPGISILGILAIIWIGSSRREFRQKTHI